MNTLNALFAMLIFPCGLFLLVNGLAYDWVDRKVTARLQNRIGPRWFQPLADFGKLLVKEEVVPQGVNRLMFHALPLVALAAVFTAALIVPLFGVAPLFSFGGDLIVALYLLGLLTLCVGLAGANTATSFSLMGSVRLFTQLFAYEAPFLLALLVPAYAASSWQLSEISAVNAGQWMLIAQPIGFVVAVLSLMGKLELPPFDAPEAETEIVGGSLVEYSGAGLALFMLAKKLALVVGLALIAALYMGGLVNPLDYLLKTLALLLVIVLIHTVMTRLRIDQVVGLWWRWGMLLVLAQWALVLLGRL
jgi:NADH-quinone oxidoreductase subunit H